MEKLLGVKVTDIIDALEREAGEDENDPRFRAAAALRDWPDASKRTLMCFIQIDPELVVSTTSDKGY
jgi:hypothetical protein